MRTIFDKRDKDYFEKKIKTQIKHRSNGHDITLHSHLEESRCSTNRGKRETRLILMDYIKLFAFE